MRANAKATYILLFLACFYQISFAACVRPVTDDAHIKISEQALKQLVPVGLQRKEILDSVRATAVPEAHGCWSSTAGDFDGQLVSVGVAQWNYGTKSLQPLLRRYRESFRTEELFNLELDRLMPAYGRKIFSNGCLRNNLTSDCLIFLKSKQGARGKLKEELGREFDALFESDAMTQIQVDAYVKVLASTSGDLKRVFPKNRMTPIRVKWAIDTKIQQGGFPGDADINRIRDRWSGATPAARKATLSAIFRWYEGLCRSLDQDGVRFDCEFNTQRWTKLVADENISEEAADLILLSHIKSRIASTKSGLYQANTFQRRVTIALGTGSIAGVRY
jgi:hypothetical protein